MLQSCNGITFMRFNVSNFIVRCVHWIISLLHASPSFFSLWLISIEGANSTLLYSPLLLLNLNKPLMLPWVSLFPSILFLFCFVLFYLMGISSSKWTINCSNTFSRREATLFKNSGFLSRRGIQSHWYKLLFLNENEDHHSLWFEKMLINIYSLWLHCHRILEMLKLCC